VVGSRNSSNSNRLREVAEGRGVRGYMIDGPQDIRREWLEGAQRVGLTAGASAPEELVQQVVARLREWGAEVIEEQQGKIEDISFPIPKVLRANTGQ
jgi:4-hydroxy-3-methylbut-2-enyl diphosphate reductase